MEVYFTCFRGLDNIVTNVVVLRLALNGRGGCGRRGGGGRCRISKTLSYMVYIIHVNSCVFYVLSEWQAFGYLGYLLDEEAAGDHGADWIHNTWVYTGECFTSPSSPPLLLSFPAHE